MGLTGRKLILLFANDERTDQPAHQCSLVIAFVVCSLENIIVKLTLDFHYSKLVSVAVQATSQPLRL